MHPQREWRDPAAAAAVIRIAFERKTQLTVCACALYIPPTIECPGIHTFNRSGILEQATAAAGAIITTITTNTASVVSGRWDAEAVEADIALILLHTHTRARKQ